MNNRRRLTLAAFGLLFAFLSCAQDRRGRDKIEEDDEKDPEGILPVSPTKLITALPAKPKTWELKRSTGESRYSGWLETRVIREFEKTIPPEKEGDPEIVRTAKITITDTGKNSDSLTLFKDFKPEKHEDYEKKFIKSLPAVFVVYGSNDIEIEILVKERFIIKYALENHPKPYLKEWLRHTKIDSLERIEDTPVVPLPELINLVKIDQLNPKKNSVYRLAVTSNSQQTKDLIADEIMEKKLIGEIPSLPEEFNFEPEGETD